MHVLPAGSASTLNNYFMQLRKMANHPMLHRWFVFEAPLHAHRAHGIAVGVGGWLACLLSSRVCVVQYTFPQPSCFTPNTACLLCSRYTDDLLRTMSKLILRDSNYRECDPDIVFEDMQGGLCICVVRFEYCVNKYAFLADPPPAFLFRRGGVQMRSPPCPLPLLPTLSPCLDASISLTFLSVFVLDTPFYPHPYL